MNDAELIANLDRSLQKVVESSVKAQAESTETGKKFEEILEILKDDLEWRKAQEGHCSQCREQLVQVVRHLKESLDQSALPRRAPGALNGLVPVVVAIIALLGVILQGERVTQKVVSGQKQIAGEITGNQEYMAQALSRVFEKVEEARETTLSE